MQRYHHFFIVVERSKIPEAVRTIYRIDVQQFGEYLCLTFIGNGFLYKMIRCLVGTLEAAGAGVISKERVREILERRCRVGAPDTAPARGLFLDQVFYDEAARENFVLERVPFFR